MNQDYYDDILYEAACLSEQYKDEECVELLNYYTDRLLYPIDLEVLYYIFDEGFPISTEAYKKYSSLIDAIVKERNRTMLE